MTSQTGTEPTSLMVGVTGHRPQRLQDVDRPLLNERVRDVLATLAAASSRTVTVLSPLAEGADQIVARQAVDAGYRLACILPFPRSVYVNDFATIRVKAEYHALLSLAASVTELDGSQVTAEERDRAYAEVGSYTVAHSEVLLAIWDGCQARGEGGTAQVVDAALAARMPVLWISSARPHAALVLTRAADGTVTESPVSSASDALREQLAQR
jgi:hypothetical protein